LNTVAVRHIEDGNAASPIVPAASTYVLVIRLRRNAVNSLPPSMHSMAKPFGENLLVTESLA